MECWLHKIQHSVHCTRALFLIINFKLFYRRLPIVTLITKNNTKIMVRLQSKWDAGAMFIFQYVFFQCVSIHGYISSWQLLNDWCIIFSFQPMFLKLIRRLLRFNLNKDSLLEDVCDKDWCRYNYYYWYLLTYQCP